MRESGVPRRSKTKNLLLLTWNIAQFNERKSDRAIRYIAEIIKKFDMIAIQEVKNNLGGIEQLQRKLGKNYGFIFSDVSGNYERLVFCYYKRNVKFTGLAAEIVNSPSHGKEKDGESDIAVFDAIKSNETITTRVTHLNGINKIKKIFEVFLKGKRIDRIEIQSSRFEQLQKEDLFQGDEVSLRIKDIVKIKDDPNKKNGIYLSLQLITEKDKPVTVTMKEKVLEFARTPHIASFRKNNCNFIVTNVHIFYGKGEGVLYRKQELEILAEYLESRSSSTDALDPDYIACGDFNIEQALNDEMATYGISRKKETETEILEKLFAALTSKELIIPDAIRKSPTNRDQTKHYDQIGYHNYPDSTIKFENGAAINWVGAVFRELSGAQLTKALSDHLPLWAEFSIQPDTNSKHINP